LPISYPSSTNRYLAIDHFELCVQSRQFVVAARHGGVYHLLLHASLAERGAMNFSPPASVNDHFETSYIDLCAAEHLPMTELKRIETRYCRGDVETALQTYRIGNESFGYHDRSPGGGGS
jgi:hypothetical protein